MVRSFEPGSKVWVRVPGLDHKLAEAWHGPYEVVEKVSLVNYKVDLGRKKPRVLHVNTLKAHKERMIRVRRLAVLADEVVEPCLSGVRLSEECVGYVDEEWRTESKRRFGQSV